MIFERRNEEPFKYRKTGGVSGSQHCTYCPKSQVEMCMLSCTTEYDKLQEERKADGVIVTDHMFEQPKQ